MREIEFRGVDAETNEWVYGGLDSKGDCISMSIGRERYITIRKETLGQYTGFKDKNGKKIFEGDVVKITTNEQVGEQKVGRNTFSKYRDVESLGLVRYGKCNYPYDKVSTWYINTEQRVEYYTSFYQDRATDKLVKTGKTIKKPIEIIKNIEVIGNIYTNQCI